MSNALIAKNEFTMYAYRIFAGDAEANADGLGEKMRALRDAYIQDAMDEMRQREVERNRNHVG